MTLEYLQNLGFQGFAPVSTLRGNNCCDVPSQMGVYAVIRDSASPPEFMEKSIGGFFKGKAPSVPIDELRRQWVDGAAVMYFGKAGGMGSTANLRTRLQQLMQFGSGKPVGHWGGRLLWQLADCDDLIVAWQSLAAEEPRSVEMALLAEFRRCYGRLPYANRV